MRELRVDPQSFGLRADRAGFRQTGTGRQLTGRVSERLVAFPPIVGHEPRVLLLGSLPGAASLAAGQYYAHPRNQFWDLMGSLVGAGRDLRYDERTAKLRDAGIAVWDVLHAAVRPGSLDTSIVTASAQANDFATLFLQQPTLGLIAFNGGAAARLFARLVPEAVRNSAPPQVTLPSTSPAHAALNAAQKLQRWQCLAQYCRQARPSASGQM